LLWHYADRPSPDHANARFILLLSAHLESGHYFNPHAQRIIEGKMAGAKLAVMDPRLSNTASMADYWMPSYPGTEAAVLLAMAMVILGENRFDAAFVKNWTNWEELEVDGFSRQGPKFRSADRSAEAALREVHAGVCGKESGVKAEVIVKTAREIAPPEAASHRICGGAARPAISADGNRRGH
jgi:anaerobic selenocysteine-containing dehydrogenase